MKVFRAALPVVAMILVMPAQAQEAPVLCAAPVAASGELAGWNEPVPMQAVGRAGQAKKVALKVGQAAQLGLVPASQLRFAKTPSRPGDASSHGGMLQIDVRAAGNYRVALGTAAWIDLIRDGKALVSTGHGHGPPCSGIRKMVDFSLRPGRYLLQIAGNAAPQTTMMVAPLP